MENFLILDILMAASGAYLIYVAIHMKQTGEVKDGVLISKKLDLTYAKDIPAFIQYVFPKTVTMGAVTLATGFLGVYNDFFGGFDLLFLLCIAVFLVVLFFWAALIMKAQKKYLEK